MRVAIINMTSQGSTGNIMFQLADKCRENGMSVKTFSPVPFNINQKPIKLELIENHTYWGSVAEGAVHCYLGVVTGMNGCFSGSGTRALVKSLKDFDPDIIHLHNLHHFCINLPQLFKYIKKHKKRVVWTLHDCWAFTGKCPHFDFIGCEKWKTGCFDCPQLSDYPKSILDVTALMYKRKKKWFNGVEDLTIVTPSQWLARNVKSSFLSDYEIRVINNGIDLSVFKPSGNSFRKKYNCENKKIVLGVAFDWSYKKGLDVFVRMSNELGEEYQIVLVGTNDTIEKDLPDNIISISKTNNKTELAEIYSAADVFVNPTREENYPTVNMEAIACGTPVVTFNTGGCKEIVAELCGRVVERDDIQSVIASIKDICNKGVCCESLYQYAARFDKENKLNEYINLYNRVNYEK